MGELSQAETERESKLKSILQRLIGRFCEHHSIWRELISTIAGNLAFSNSSVCPTHFGFIVLITANLKKMFAQNYTSYF